MSIKKEKVEKWRLIGKNVPKLEVAGPFSNQYTIFVEDIDGDLIGLKPAEAIRLIDRLQKALQGIEDHKAPYLKKVSLR